MTDSTIDEKSNQRAAGIVPSADDLFGEIGGDEPLEGNAIERRPGERDDSGEIEDRTASDVFDRLRTETTGDTDALLEDESPEEIIASADEADEDGNHNPLIDEDALETLLLTGRTKGEEFLWIDSSDDDSGNPDSADGPDGAAVETRPAAASSIGDTDARAETDSATDEPTDAPDGPLRPESAVDAGRSDEAEADDPPTTLFGRIRSILGRLF